MRLCSVCTLENGKILAQRPPVSNISLFSELFPLFTSSPDAIILQTQSSATKQGVISPLEHSYQSYILQISGNDRMWRENPSFLDKAYFLQHVPSRNDGGMGSPNGLVPSC